LTEIILALPRDLVAELDAVKLRDGLRSRSQVVQQLLQAGRAADQQRA
jgi:metal-responsive CopG/Arc/MetJ family transcriptional regulator